MKKKLLYICGRDKQILILRKAAKIRNGFNQVPCLTRDTTWESDKNTIKHHKQEPRDINNTNYPQKKYRLGSVSKDILMEGLSHIGHIGQASFFGTLAKSGDPDQTPRNEDYF